MKGLKILLLLPLLAFSAQAQKAWIEDEENFDPNLETKFMVDIAKCECQRLLNSSEPLYLWTWAPAELPANDPNANGEWTNSNDALQMTDEGNNIWSFTMIPTEFYKVGAKKVYEDGFSFLVKAKDGTGEGGGGCNEDKTEDLMIEVEAPEGASLLLSSFPFQPISDDIVTVLYDNTIEENPSMVDLPADEAYVVPQVLGSDSQTYNYTSFFQVPTKDELRMTKLENGTFVWSIVPEDFFSEVLPSGIRPVSLNIVVRKKTYTGSADRVSEDLDIPFGCP